MKVLLTGAFGNLGSLVVEQLLNNGHSVLALDLDNKVNRKVAKSFKGNPDLTIHWGDIRDKALIQNLVSRVEAIIHLAAIIVPDSELRPELAYAVNVIGTENIVTAIRESSSKPLLAYCSSFAVFGPQPEPPPRRVDEEPIPSDHYTEHKIQCEKMVQKLESPWAILRLGGMADSRMRNRGVESARYALAMDANNRFEYIHPKDAATAFVNLLVTPEAYNQIHLIGGGKTCQVAHKDILSAALEALGVSIPESFFGTNPLYADYADTTESQRLLKFQRHSFDDFKTENMEAFKTIRPFAKPLAPIIRRAIKRIASS